MNFPEDFENIFGKNFTIEKVFSWYDFPRLFFAKSDTEKWLGLWIDSDDTGNEWYYLQLNHENKGRLVLKHIDLRTAFLGFDNFFFNKEKPQYILKVSTRYNGDDDSVEKVIINPEYLPKSGIFLENEEKSEEIK